MNKKSLIKLLVITLLLSFPLIAFSNEKAAKGPAYQNELLVLGAIKKLYAAEREYLNNVVQPHSLASAFGTLKQLGEFGYIDPTLASGEKFGYRFDIHTISRTTITPPNIVLYATPKVYRKTGVRSFFMNIDCAIKGADHGGFFAEWTDPVIESCTPAIAYSYGEQAMSDLRTIASAEFTYQATSGNGHFGTYEQLVEAGLISEFTRLNYHRALIETNKPSLIAPASFKVWSTPTIYRQSGVLSLFIDDTGILRGSDRGGQPAHEDDPPIMLNAARYSNKS
jgi:hypothetical protein